MTQTASLSPAARPGAVPSEALQPAARQPETPATRLVPELTHGAIQRALAGAIAVAERLGIAINVAVVDRSGVLAGFVRMPGAFLHSADIATDKAYTAVSFGKPTSAWGPALESLPADVARGLAARPRFAGFGGGLPIVLDGVRVGGIGVSGGSAEQDADCAQAGIDAMGLV